MKIIQKLKECININSIRTSMVLSFMLLISFLVMFFSLISYYYTIKDLENTSISYTVSLLNEISSSIDTYIANTKSISRVVVENRDVIRLMNFYNQNYGKTLTPVQKIRLEELRSNVVAHMGIVQNTRDEITNIAIISRKGDVVLSDPKKRVNEFSEYNLTDWYLRPLSYFDDIIVSPSHVQNLIADEYKWVISISKSIIDPETDAILGVMVIDLNYKSIEKICENAQLGKSGYIYMIDKFKNIIYHPQQQPIYSGIKNELVKEILKLDESNPLFRDEASNKIYIRTNSVMTDWSIVGVVNADELIRNKLSTIDFYLILSYIAILVAAILATIISTAITKPIKTLENTMHRAEEGDFSVRSQITLNNEIGHLGNTFNEMIFKIKALMDNTVAAEEEKRKSEIKALQAQINPHFLYNTLDAIIWMSAGGKNEEVVEMTSALAKLFRTSISEGDKFIPLAVEIENIQSYLVIQKIRYKDKLTYRIEIPPQLLSLKTPKLILQPIVENAVYHGIKMSPNGGEIRIGAYLQEQDVVVTVEDDGVGMSKEQIAHLFVQKQNNDRGIGIINVNNRIKLCFGEHYGLHYESRLGVGTRVQIRLPKIEDGEKNE